MIEQAPRRLSVDDSLGTFEELSIGADGTDEESVAGLDIEDDEEEAEGADDGEKRKPVRDVDWNYHSFTQKRLG
jgi:hypothetical protein